MIESIDIKKLGINGEGIGYYNRKIVFVPGALPGENVSVDINTNTKKGFLMGKLIKVNQPSKNRQAVNCRQDDMCQGCSLLHMNYETTLRYKKDAIKESLQKYTDFNLKNVKFDDVIPCNQKEGFITSVNLPIAEFKGKITFGIYQRETKFLTIMNRCFKQHPLINQTLQELETILNKHQCKDYNDKFKKGLRFIKLRVIDNKVGIVIICGKDGLKEAVSKDIQGLPQVNGLFVSINTTRYQNFNEAGYTKIFGTSKGKITSHGKNFIYSIKSELPDNIEMHLKRDEVIMEMLKDSSKIISVDSGLGMWELNIDKEVIAIEESRDLINDAKANKKFNKCDKIEYVKEADKLVTYAKKKIYDTLVVSLDRNSMDDDVKDTIRYGNFKTVLIISTSHYAMAKDLCDLSRYFKIQEIKALDTNPYTPYVTTILKLVK